MTRGKGVVSLISWLLFLVLMHKKQGMSSLARKVNVGDAKNHGTQYAAHLTKRLHLGSRQLISHSHECKCKCKCKGICSLFFSFFLLALSNWVQICLLGLCHVGFAVMTFLILYVIFNFVCFCLWCCILFYTILNMVLLRIFIVWSCIMVKGDML